MATSRVEVVLCFLSASAERSQCSTKSLHRSNRRIGPCSSEHRVCLHRGVRPWQPRLDLSVTRASPLEAARLFPYLGQERVVLTAQPEPCGYRSLVNLDTYSEYPCASRRRSSATFSVGWGTENVGNPTVSASAQKYSICHLILSLAEAIMSCLSSSLPFSWFSDSASAVRFQEFPVCHSRFGRRHRPHAHAAVPAWPGMFLIQME